MSRKVEKRDTSPQSTQTGKTDGRGEGNTSTGERAAIEVKMKKKHAIDRKER